MGGSQNPLGTDGLEQSYSHSSRDGSARGRAEAVRLTLPSEESPSGKMMESSLPLTSVWVKAA